MKFPSILPDILMCSFVTVLDVYKKPNCRHGSFHFYNYVKRSISCLGIESKYWLEVVKPCFIRNGYWWVINFVKLVKKYRTISKASLKKGNSGTFLYYLVIEHIKKQISTRISYFSNVWQSSMIPPTKPKRLCWNGNKTFSPIFADVFLPSS